jgi:hypothetical protein
LFPRLAGVIALAVSAGAYERQQWSTASKPSFEHDAPVVYQAAGPDVASIQSTVDRFRAALGANNGSTPGPLEAGRREINWDGGGRPRPRSCRRPSPVSRESRRAVHSARQRLRAGFAVFATCRGM